MKNVNGQGTIYYEKDRKSFRAEIFDTKGERIRKRFKTKHEAEEWLTVLRAEFITQTYIAKTDYTLGEWLIEYLSTYIKQNVRPTTFRNYKGSAKHFESIAGIKIDELNSTYLQKHFNIHFKDKPTAKFNAYALLNASLKKAVDLELIRKNPCDNVSISRPNAKDVIVFTQEEMTKLLEFLKNDRHYKRYYLMILTASLTGMRIGEICGLKWDCVFPEHISVKSTLSNLDGVRYQGKPKTKQSERDITIPKFLYDLLNASPHTCEYVFPTRNGNGILPTNFDSATWPRLMNASGLPFKNFHTLRHTHATLLLANGVSIAEVSRRLGHKKISTTFNIYCHFIPNFDKTLPDKIANIYGIAPTLPPI